MNSLCIQQHVHTTHMWNAVKEGGGERDRDRERKTRNTGREGERKQLRHSPLILCVSSQT